VVLAIVIPVILIGIAIVWRMAGRHGGGAAMPAAIASAAVIQVGVAPRPSKVITFSQGCRTSECHASMLSAAHVHGPVARDACDACHAPDTGGHKYPMTRDREALCRGCHTVADTTPRRHMSMNDDGCTSCHDPHTSASPGMLRGASIDQTCAQCHAPTEGVNRHHPYAAGRCDLCHPAHGETGRETTNSAAIEAGCRTCHPTTADAVAHSPHSQSKVEGSCLACHRAHASDGKGLLKNEPRTLCISCHEKVGESVAGVVTHDAVLGGQQCITCHAAHESPNASMLVSDQASVCNSCHQRSVVAADGREIPARPAGREAESFVHGPVASGDCAACHTVHGGNQARLLKRMNPAVLAGTFDTRNYSLCFSCHDSELMLSESASDTWFRNGETNLHRVHLASGNRSRTCSACHVAHAGRRPRLMAESASYDGSAWKMPLGFSLTPEGGSCSPGCHEPMSYRRDAGAPNHNQPQRGAP
jgi:predicted CXXCH cytochrome family protein